MELADQQSSENEVLSSTSTPTGEPSGSNSGAETPSSSDKSVPEKPLTLREQINKSVEAVRTEEAKRARAADGKFAKLETGAAEKPATENQVSQPEKEAQPEASKASGPPPGWSAESKTFFNSLPADHPIRRDVAKREEEVSKGFKEYSTKTAQLTEISQVLDPLRPILQQSGIQSDAQAVKQLVQWEGALRNPQTRMQAFQTLAKQYGVDISTLVPSSQSGAPSAAQDIPEPLRPVIDQFGNIQQQVQSMDARFQSWEQQQINRELQSFASDPKHPHYESVRVKMGQLMNAGMASGLEDAYQQAVLLHPEIAAQMRAEEDKKRAEDLAKANAEKARRASLAAVSPSTRPPAGAAPGKENAAKSVRGAILSAVQQHREEQRA